MNKLILILTLSIVSAGALAKDGLVLTWKTSNGNWKACGPVQCTSAQSKTEEEALDLVTHDKHKPTYQHTRFGKCWVYSVINVESYENSSSKVKNKSDC
ncbi:hypothetical protein LZU85_20465 [Vibrio sp. IRLE0018]|uniref:hypothetical protein n=1 Tax=Vibrio floridensis TaxID=2908007 RepID=UPI001F3683EC|nr:hypothetical protein [Vibrio floridensis]ELH7496560.1 hypothetical protein [Vibrio vulnificus]ELK2279585.1 hypothetical protein [Vibrio vulnificus]MCF8781170.1 hypothetical protein [Vibrio floridensis]